MKFLLVASGTFYDDDEKGKIEDLGFQFELFDQEIPQHKWRMIGPYPEIEIGSLEELIEFMQHWGELIIRTIYARDRQKLCIEIYNDHRE